MKILVVSLLRLGDVILSTPIIKGLSQKYPNAEIHILMNKQFEGVSGLIPYVSQFHYFDRKLIQDGLVQAERPLFEPYHRLESLLTELDKENYSEVINLTHNKMSGWLCSLIKGKEKKGLAINPRGQASLWFPLVSLFK